MGNLDNTRNATESCSILISLTRRVYTHFNKNQSSRQKKLMTSVNDLKATGSCSADGQDFSETRKRLPVNFKCPQRGANYLESLNLLSHSKSITEIDPVSIFLPPFLWI